MKNLLFNIKGDLLGGLTAGIVALPLALAFGVSSGLGPSAGLYGAIFLSFFAALFGGTPTQISGPTAPMTAVSMVVIAAIIAVNNGSLEQALPFILAVFLLSGLFSGFILLGNGSTKSIGVLHGLYSVMFFITVFLYKTQNPYADVIFFEVVGEGFYLGAFAFLLLIIDHIDVILI